MKKFIALLLILWSCLYLRAQVTVTIPASADNTIYQSPSGNSNALGQNLFSGTNGGASPRRCLIKFDIAAAIPPGAFITSATLTLNCNTSRTIPDNVSLHKLSNQWGEATSNAGATGDGAGVAATENDATWLANLFNVSNWNTPGGDFSASASATQSINSEGFYSWTSGGMITDVQSWLNMPATNYGWILLCNETTPATARKFASRENTILANRPALSITYTTVLPVSLHYFSATEKHGSALLKWETSSEINNAHFKIMHSSDGNLFTQLARVNSPVTPAPVNRYVFTHPGLAPGIHYYKIIQVDLDGREQHSAIEKVEIARKVPYVQIWPNPVTEQLHIEGLSPLPGTVYTITDATGAVVQKDKFTSLSIQVIHLKRGVYLVSFYRENKLLGTGNFIKIE